jgi:hypothetical protein
MNYKSQEAFRLLNRKQLTLSKEDKINTEKYQGHDIRKRILLSRGDSLTNDDLINHHKELRIKKLSKLLWTIPFLEYYFIRMNKGLFYSIPLTFILYSIVNKMNIRKTEYSYSFAKKSEVQHMSTILQFNLKKIATPNDKWNWRQKACSYAEWLAKNEYK